MAKDIKQPTPPPAGGFNPLAAQVPLWLPMGFALSALVSGLALLIGLVAFWGDFTSIDPQSRLLTDLVLVRLQPRLLALVHLFTLGFGSAVTIGVLYQMAPVVLVTKLYSPAIGWASLATFVPGLATIVASFYVFHIPGLIVGALLTVVGGILFVYNMVRTWQSSPEDSLTRRFMLPTVASFMLTLIFGLTVALTWRYGWRLGPQPLDLLSAHLFVGFGGWFTGIVIGVSYVLIPMFRLVHGHDHRLGYTIFKLLYAGVALGVAAPFVGAWAGGLAPLAPWLTGLGLLSVAAAVGLYGRDFYALWRGSLRAPDMWMLQVPWAVGYMVAAAVGAVVAYLVHLVGVRLPVGIPLAITALYALGFIATMVLALLHKIVPFLVWYHRYMARIGTGKVPLMKDLVNEGRGQIGFMMYHSGLIMAIVAIAANIPAAARGAFALMALAFAVLMSDLIQLLLPRLAKQGVVADVKPTP